MKQFASIAMCVLAAFGFLATPASGADEELAQFCLKFKKNQKLECVLTEDSSYRSIFVTKGAEISPNPMTQQRVMELDIEVKAEEEKAAPATIRLHYKSDKRVIKNSSGDKTEAELPTTGRTIEIKKGADEPTVVDGLGELQASRGCIVRFEKIFGWADAIVGGRILESGGTWELKDEQAEFIYRLTVGKRSTLTNKKDLELKSKAAFKTTDSGKGTITLELTAEAADTTVGSENGESKAVKWTYSFELTIHVDLEDQTFTGIESKAVTRWEPEQLQPGNTKIVEETESIHSEMIQR